MRMIAIDDVLYFQSEDKYTKVVTADGDALIRKPIKELYDELDHELLAGPPRHDRQPARDREVERDWRDQPCSRSRTAREADRVAHVRAPLQGDVTAGHRGHIALTAWTSELVVRFLAFAGRHATAVMAAGVLLGLAVPPLASLARPLLVPTLLIPLALALVRLDWAAAAHGGTVPARSRAARVWILGVSPLAVWAVTLALVSRSASPNRSRRRWS